MFVLHDRSIVLFRIKHQLSGSLVVNKLSKTSGCTGGIILYVNTQLDATVKALPKRSRK